MAKAKKNYHHGDLKEALLEAALGLMQETGSMNFSIRDISKIAGVSHMAAYRHFQGKEEILYELSERGFKLFNLALKEASAEGDLLKALTAQAKAYVGFSLKNPMYFRIMFSREVTAAEIKNDDASAAAFLQLQHLVSSLIEKKVFKKMNLDEATMVVWSSMHGLSSLLLEGFLKEQMKSMGPEKLVTKLTENIYVGLLRK